MTHVKKIKMIAMVLCFTMLTTKSLFAQEWSPVQKEVWKNVEAYWDFFAKGDLEGFASYYHADYRGWSNQDAMPSTKSTAKKFLEYGMKSSKTLVYSITPVVIQVYGNIAFVHYYYSSVDKAGDSPAKTNSGRWTDILMKQGDKWVMIGDHGGQTSSQ